MRRHKRQYLKSSSGANDDNDFNNDDGDNKELKNDTDGMTYLDPYLNISRSVSNMVCNVHYLLLAYL